MQDGSMLSYCLAKIVVVAEIVLNMFCSIIPVLVQFLRHHNNAGDQLQYLSIILALIKKLAKGIKNYH